MKTGLSHFQFINLGFRIPHGQLVFWKTPLSRLYRKSKNRLTSIPNRRVWTKSQHSLRNLIQAARPVHMEEFNLSNVHLTPNAISGSRELDYSSDVGPVLYNEPMCYETDEIMVSNGASTIIGQVSQAQIHSTREALRRHSNLQEQRSVISPQNQMNYENQTLSGLEMHAEPSALAIPTYSLSSQASQSQSNPPLSEIELYNVLNHNSPPVQVPIGTTIIPPTNLSPTEIVSAPQSALLDRDKGTIMIPSLSSTGCPNAIEITHTVTLKCVPFDAPAGASETPAVQLLDRGLWATNPIANSSPMDVSGQTQGIMNTLAPPLLPQSSSKNLSRHVTPNLVQSHYSVDSTKRRSLTDKERLLTQSSAVDEMGQRKHSPGMINKQETGQVDSLLLRNQSDSAMSNEPVKKEGSCCAYGSKSTIDVEDREKSTEYEPDEEKLGYCCFRRRKKQKNSITRSEHKSYFSSSTEGVLPFEMMYNTQDNPESPAVNETVVPDAVIGNVSSTKVDPQQELISNLSEHITVPTGERKSSVLNEMPRLSDATVKTEQSKPLKIVRFDQSYDDVENREEIQPSDIYILDENAPLVPVDNQSVKSAPQTDLSATTVPQTNQTLAINEPVESPQEEDSFPGDVCTSPIDCCGLSSSRTQNYRSKSSVASILSQGNETTAYHTTPPAFTEGDFEINPTQLESPCPTIVPATQSPDELENMNPYPPVPSAPLPTDPSLNPAGSMAKAIEDSKQLPYNLCPYCIAMTHRCVYVQHLPAPCVQHYSTGSGICSMCGANMLNVPGPCMCHSRPCYPPPAKPKKRCGSSKGCVFSCSGKKNSPRPTDAYPIQPVPCPYYNSKN